MLSPGWPAASGTISNLPPGLACGSGHSWGPTATGPGAAPAPSYVLTILSLLLLPLCQPFPSTFISALSFCVAHTFLLPTLAFVILFLFWQWRSLHVSLQRPPEVNLMSSVGLSPWQSIPLGRGWVLSPVDCVSACLCDRETRVTKRILILALSLWIDIVWLIPRKMTLNKFACSVWKKKPSDSKGA